MVSVRPPEPLQLAAVGPSSGRAREYVRTGLTSLGHSALLDSAELGVSEMVTNACLHARTPLVVALRVVDPDTVRIEVTDGSPRTPQLRGQDLMATTGRGLQLLACFGEWGVEPLRPPAVGKTVWFEPAAEPSQDRPGELGGLDAWTEA